VIIILIPLVILASYYFPKRDLFTRAWCFQKRKFNATPFPNKPYIRYRYLGKSKRSTD
jgi:hypothetical protein